MIVIIEGNRYRVIDEYREYSKKAFEWVVEERDKGNDVVWNYNEITGNYEIAERDD